MAVSCGVSFGICAVRLTKLDSLGNVAATPPNNSYVTDNPITVTVTPNIEEGNTFSLRNGCGCSIARFKANDIFNWFEFTFNAGGIEPEMEAFLLGATTIVDGADQVGIHFPSPLACEETEPAVAFEYWTKHIDGNAPDATYPWVHWVFPRTVWRLADNTFEEDIRQASVQGFSRSNPLWGSGPYGDGPVDDSDIVEGAWWLTDLDPPAAVCASAAVTPAS
jgi:hypothetical protein